VGHFELFDHDVVDVTNLNRQIIATHSTIGRKKVEVMKERMLDINPEVDVVIHDCFYLPENASEFPFDEFDYVVDCVDTVTAKLEIITRCNAEKIPVISSMGTGNKLDPTRFEVTDLFKTSVCPLAKVMRRECKARGIKKLKVVYSKEEPISLGQRTPGSISFVPPAAGLALASEVIKDLSK
jgi:tRNA A37 threonylcarbamoyladenosine dehydratase